MKQARLPFATLEKVSISTKPVIGKFKTSKNFQIMYSNFREGLRAEKETFSRRRGESDPQQENQESPEG